MWCRSKRRRVYVSNRRSPGAAFGAPHARRRRPDSREGGPKPTPFRCYLESPFCSIGTQQKAPDRQDFPRPQRKKPVAPIVRPGVRSLLSCRVVQDEQEATKETEGFDNDPAFCLFLCFLLFHLFDRITLPQCVVEAEEQKATEITDGGVEHKLCHDFAWRISRPEEVRSVVSYSVPSVAFCSTL